MYQSLSALVIGKNDSFRREMLDALKYYKGEESLPSILGVTADSCRGVPSDHPRANFPLALVEYPSVRPEITVNELSRLRETYPNMNTVLVNLSDPPTFISFQERNTFQDAGIVGEIILPKFVSGKSVRDQVFDTITGLLDKGKMMRPLDVAINGLGEYGRALIDAIRDKPWRARLYLYSASAANGGTEEFNYDAIAEVMGLENLRDAGEVIFDDKFQDWVGRAHNSNVVVFDTGPHIIDYESEWGVVGRTAQGHLDRLLKETSPKIVETAKALKDYDGSALIVSNPVEYCCDIFRHYSKMHSNNIVGLNGDGARCANIAYNCIRATNPMGARSLVQRSTPAQSIRTCVMGTHTVPIPVFDNTYAFMHDVDGEERIIQEKRIGELVHGLKDEEGELAMSLEKELQRKGQSTVRRAKKLRTAPHLAPRMAAQALDQIACCRRESSPSASFSIWDGSTYALGSMEFDPVTNAFFSKYEVNDVKHNGKRNRIKELLERQKKEIVEIIEANGV